MTCSPGVTTTITGTVFAGTQPVFGTPDPVPNVVVYVPNTAVQPFAPGVTCSQCGAEVTGDPLVQTTTAFDGTFTLTNMPVGNNIPLVIQLGRWRRQFTITVPSCVTTTLPASTLIMPHNQGEGDIPLTAFSSGSVDTLECVLFKMGVDQAEFTTNTGGGRVHMYEGNGASLGAGTPSETALMGNGGTFANYDQILFPCWGVDPTGAGSSNRKSAAELANLVTYANEGGHFFATHFSFAWLYNNNPFNTTAQWDVDYNSFNSGTAQVQLPPTNPKGTIFTNWLHLVGALPNPPNLKILNPRHDVDKVLLQSVDWMSGGDPNDGTPMLYHYTFNTPVGAQNQCGHAIFSDFHVANASVDSTTVFPAECMTNETTGAACTTGAPCPMTPQEKVLEYMIWDLASCVPGPPTPSCTPITCADQNIGCGPAGDGCGNELQCGPCTPPLTCGGGGKARSVRGAGRRHLRPQDVPRPGHQLRPGRRRLRQRDPQLRQLHAPADLRRRRPGGPVRPARRRELPARDLRAAEHLLRSRGRRLRQPHSERLRHVHASTDVRRRRGLRAVWRRRRRHLHAQVVRRAGSAVRRGQRRLRQRHQLPELPQRPDVQHDDGPVPAELAVSDYDLTRQFPT